MISVSTAEGGIVFNKKTGNPEVLKNAMKNYMQSKVGNVFLASEAAKRFGGDGIISLVRSHLSKHTPEFCIILGQRQDRLGLILSIRA